MSIFFRYLPLILGSACLAYPFFASDLSVEMFWVLVGFLILAMIAGIAVACREPLPENFHDEDAVREAREHYDKVGYLSDPNHPMSPIYMDSRKLFDDD